MRHPEEIPKKSVQDSAAEVTPIETEEGEVIVLKARKKKGYQSRPEEGAKPLKVQQKKSDVWKSSKASSGAVESTKSVNSVNTTR